METQTTTQHGSIHIFSINDKDTVRKEEQHHESLLRKQLLEMGIIVEFDRILPHGINKLNGEKI